MGKADFFRVQKAGNEQVEELIVVNLIVNSNFASRIAGKINTEHISSPHLRIICNWAIEYYKQYGRAPKQGITEIFEVESSSLSEEKADQIAAVLEGLSDKYTEKAQNTDYIYKKSVEYLDRQELLVRARNTISLAEKGFIDKARNEIRTYNEIKESISENGVFITPENFYRTVHEEEETGVMRLPGALGKMIGPLERGWLVSFLAPMKRGKTFYLVDWGIEGYLQGLKVVLFSLEMKEKDIDRRLFTAMTGKPYNAGTILLPVYDCLHNQQDSCHREERVCNVGLLDEEGTKPRFEDADPEYEPCTACRGNKELAKYYKIESWFIEEDTEGIEWRDINPVRGNLSLRNPKNIRRFCPPINTVEFSYIEDTLNDLELTDGFIPDVVVVDYADLLTSTLRADLRHQLNDIWQNLARMAAVRNILVLTASQTNRPAMKAKTLEEDASAEDIRKNAHVSAMIGINQSKKLREKEKGLLRLNLLYHRFREVTRAECLTTQQLSISRVCLDSMLVIPEDEGYIYVGG